MSISKRCPICGNDDLVQAGQWLVCSVCAYHNFPSGFQVTDLSVDDIEKLDPDEREKAYAELLTDVATIGGSLIAAHVGRLLASTGLVKDFKSGEAIRVLVEPAMSYMINVFRRFGLDDKFRRGENQRVGMLDRTENRRLDRPDPDSSFGDEEDRRSSGD